jgi:hypothetical protein
MKECFRNEAVAMTKLMRGVVHGRTIELSEELGVADGQEVEVEVTIKPPGKEWGAGILSTAGALADDPHWDAIMGQVQQARKAQRRPQLDGE